MSQNQESGRVFCLYSNCLKDFKNDKAMRKHMEEFHKPVKWCPFTNCQPKYNAKRRNRVVKHMRVAHGTSRDDASELGRSLEGITPYIADPIWVQNNIQDMAGSAANTPAIYYWQTPQMQMTGSASIQQTIAQIVGTYEHDHQIPDGGYASFYGQPLANPLLGYQTQPQNPQFDTSPPGTRYPQTTIVPFNPSAQAARDTMDQETWK